MALPSPLVDDPQIQQNFDAIQAKLRVLDLIHFGAGDPEGVVTAPTGHIYLRSDGGGAGANVYEKHTGTGDTGWGALS